MLRGKRVIIGMLVAGFLVAMFGFGFSQEVSIPEYRCKKIKEKVKIDGLLDEKVWENAEIVNFVDVEKATLPSFPTQAKMLWDNEHLYIGFKCDDVDVWAIHREKDFPLFEDEVVEVFIDPDGDEKDYIEIEVNSYNTVLDLFVPIPGHGASGWRREALWDAKGLKTAVHIEGTINDWTDTDSYWSVEIAIPWENFSVAKAENLPPKKGDVWRINLCHNESPFRQKNTEYTAWSPTGAINFHVPKKFGKVIFED